MPEYFIGTSGWHYDHWQGSFYPDKLPKAKWLEFYADHFNTVELNNSFYNLPTENAFNNWLNSSPENFIFTVKVNRYITHIKRLKDIKEPLDRFLSRADILQEKLGPLLYQLPPNMKRDDKTLDAVLSMLPFRYSHVVEFRHESWFDDGVFKILSKYNVGLCVFDKPDFTCPIVATSNFTYFRFHGSSELYSSCYSELELSDWAKRIVDTSRNKKAVYIYFNNDAEAYAIENARAISKILVG